MNNAHDNKYSKWAMALVSLWLAGTAMAIKDICPEKEKCWPRAPEKCAECHIGWRWALRAEMKEDKS